MRVLLVCCDRQDRVIETTMQPLWPAYLAAYADHHDPGRYDFKVLHGPGRDLGAVLQGWRPEVVGLSAVTQNFGLVGQVAQEARRRCPGALVVLGGPHITLLPETLPGDVDAGVVGEGEQTFLELLRWWRRRLDGLDLDPEALAKIPGLVWRGPTGEFCRSGPRPLIENLDDIPEPRRDLLPRSPRPYLFSSRGCPYDCSFCASTKLWSRVRFHSAERVHRELEALYRAGHREVDFYDDLFVANRARVKALGALLRASGLNGKFRLHVGCRANLVDLDLCRELRGMGVRSVNMGLESGSDASLRRLKGGNVTVQNNHDAVRCCNASGIKVLGSFVVGDALDTREDVLATFNFIRDHRLHSAVVGAMTPLPGTPVWDEARSRGLVGVPMFWRDLDMDYWASWRTRVHVGRFLSRLELHDLMLKFRRLDRFVMIRAAFFMFLTEPGRLFRTLWAQWKPRFSWSPLQWLQRIAIVELCEHDEPAKGAV